MGILDIFSSGIANEVKPKNEYSNNPIVVNDPADSKKELNSQETLVSEKAQIRQSKAAMRKCKCESARLKFMLPEDFKVSVNGHTVINHPCPGFKQVALPTFNHYQGQDGGYMAIYSARKEGSAYEICDGIYVVGQIRVPGHYEGRIFVADDSDSEILKICEQYFPEMKGQIWLGGDTGGWFGIQLS